MRKVLLGSTALVAAGVLAGTVARGAEPITLSLGGYYNAFLTMRAQSDVDNEGVGAVQSTFGNDEDIHHTDVDQEGEVWFVGTTTLDNGVKVGVNIQLEAHQAGDQIDEHYVFFEGDFGRFVIGAENSAPFLMHDTAPAVVPGHGLDSPNLFTMVAAAGNAAVTAGDPVITFANISSDANKVTYFSPRHSSGFRFGLSYTPDTTDGGGRGGTGGTLVSDSEDTGQEHVIGLGVNIVRRFGRADFAWSFGYERGFVEGNGTANGVACGGAGQPVVCITDPDNQQGRDVLTTGFNVGLGGWIVGGAARWDDEGEERNNDQFDTILGVTYGAGPWLFGLQGAYGRDGDGEVNTACDTATNNTLLSANTPADGTNSGCTNDADQVVAGELGGSYALGPGIKAAAALHGWTGWGNDGNENFSGVAFTVGTGLRF
ncbi:MAG: porin [Kiloniellales bacterium]